MLHVRRSVKGHHHHFASRRLLHRTDHPLQRLTRTTSRKRRNIKWIILRRIIGAAVPAARKRIPPTLQEGKELRIRIIKRPAERGRSRNPIRHHFILQRPHIRLTSADIRHRQLSMPTGVIPDLEPLLGHRPDLSPRHVPILALPEQIGIRHIERPIETMLLQDRRSNRRMTRTAIVESKHHQPLRNRLPENSQRIVNLPRLRHHNARKSKQHGHHHSSSHLSSRVPDLHRLSCQFILCLARSPETVPE